MQNVTSGSPPPASPLAWLKQARRAAGLAWRLTKRTLRHTLLRPVFWAYERNLERNVRAGSMPKHVGIIMDGNRRFAKTLRLGIGAGHAQGASKAKEVLDWCLQMGIMNVTMWGFSTDNRGRSDAEVAHIHNLVARQARELAEDPRLTKHQVRVRVIGDVTDFSADARAALKNVENLTRDHTGMNLQLALGYGGREEIVAAMQRLLLHAEQEGKTLSDVASTLNLDDVAQHLWSAGVPDPDFIIRTSGEERLSGFMLWQSVYAEFYFCDAFWPDFRRLDFLRALRAFQARERRFGR